ncbi:MAG: hypothetical protein KGQ59_07190 [Bdellovibrionales bacterium]|nr:hypothetical protein [Bdellovibrionales bacterium]
MLTSKYSNTRHPQYTQGLTLVELVISLGITGITVLAGGAMWNAHNKSAEKLSALIETNIEAAIAEKVLFSDIRDSEASFHLLRLGDDSNLNFFDLANDVACQCQTNLTLNKLSNCPLSSWTPSSGSKQPCERTLTMRGSQLGQGSSCTMAETGPFFLLVGSAPPYGSAFLINPRDFYDFTPVTINGSGTMTYRGLGRIGPSGNPAIDQSLNVLESNPVSFWGNSSGKLVALMVALPMREHGTNGQPIPTTFPRMASFLGTPSGTMLQKFNRNLGVTLNFTSPLDANDPNVTNRVFNSDDDFFRRMPLAGGTAPRVLARQLKLVKYELTQDGAPPTLTDPCPKYNLVRSEYELSCSAPVNVVPGDKDGGCFSTKVVLAKDVEELRFFRKISDSAFRYIVKLRKKARLGS